MNAAAYVLGHSEHELRRLEHQGAFLRPLTRNLLVRAGVAPGMRVLDFGAGAGDVSLLASELVGETGEVVALERAAPALEHLRMRLDARGVTNVRILEGDESALAKEPGFDAVVGRLVLLHQKDPVETISTLAARLRPGGVMAFHEVEIEAGCWSAPKVAGLQQVFDWICGAFSRGGMAHDIGRRMSRGFVRAGLADIHLVREGPMEPASSPHGYEFLTNTVRSLLPVLVKLGLATEEEVGIDTLAQRLRAEAVVLGAHFIPVFFAAGWARKPG